MNSTEIIAQLQGKIATLTNEIAFYQNVITLAQDGYQTDQVRIDEALAKKDAEVAETITGLQTQVAEKDTAITDLQTQLATPVVETPVISEPAPEVQ